MVIDALINSAKSLPPMLLSIVLTLLIPNSGFAQLSCFDAFGGHSKTETEHVNQQTLRIVLQDGDLSLEPLNRNHAMELQNLFAVPEVNELYLGGVDPGVAADHYLKRSQSNSGKYRSSFDTIWAIEHDGEFAGIIMMTEAKDSFLGTEYSEQFRKRNSNEVYVGIGYALHPAFQRRGLATRSVAVISEFARLQLKATYLFARVKAMNRSSIAVLRRNGFTAATTESAERQRFFKKLN